MSSDRVYPMTSLEREIVALLATMRVLRLWPDGRPMTMPEILELELVLPRIRDALLERTLPA